MDRREDARGEATSIEAQRPSRAAMSDGYDVSEPAGVSEDAVQGRARATAAARASQAAVIDAEAASNFGTDVHSYLRENIVLADQKAAALFAALGGMLAYLGSQGAARELSALPGDAGGLQLLLLVAVAAMVLGAATALLVIAPRTSGASTGKIFWGAVARYQTADDYADSVCAETGATLVRSKLMHCHELALVCRKKYRTLHGAVALGSTGLWAAVAYIGWRLLRSS